LAGDQQRGYERLTLLYDGAELVGATVDGLRTWRLTEPNVELVEDELDLSEDGRYEHRMLISPEGEIAVRFRSLAVTRHPAEPTERR
jgi:hypothetical protein